MEPKVEKRVSENGEGIKPESEVADYPTQSRHPTSGVTDFSTLDRPWVNRGHTLRDYTEGELWQRIQPQDGNIMERWKNQSMADGPYQNVNSIVTDTKSEQSEFSSIQSPKPVKPVSEAAATSGSK
ncbi:hypothetical protein F4774DRAFT_410509 [Daldinia eschscholtzii]|nr:hypothetical protein F4774DRAFT_410509 [Daldinia eschscholtzii]